MKKSKSILFLILTITISCELAYSQQVVSNMGASLQNSSGSIAFTLGEPVMATLSASNGIITQGFHQTKITVTAIDENHSNSIFIKVYPNPTTDLLYVSLDFDEISHIRLVLYDLSGRILYAFNADEALTKVDFSSYLSGTYILKIYKANMAIGVFKIVKTE